MQPLHWLELAGKTLTDVATDLVMNLATVSRHFRGIRNPHPDLVKRYEDYTKGAVKAEDWIELWNEPSAIAARAAEEEKGRLGKARDRKKAAA